MTIKELKNLLYNFGEKGTVFLHSFDMDGEETTRNITSIEVMNGNIYLRDHTGAFDINE